MNRLTLLALAPLLIATTAHASRFGPERGYEDQDNRAYGNYDNSQRYAGNTVEYADVIDARPIYSSRENYQPQRECHEERVQYRGEQRNNFDRTTGSVLGGVIGGVIGNQVARGGARPIATVVGAVIGAQIGGNVADERYNERDSYQTRCTTVQQRYSQPQVSGYDVTYRLHGRSYQTRLPYNPGRQLAVQVNVTPVR